MIEITIKNDRSYGSELEISVRLPFKCRIGHARIPYWLTCDSYWKWQEKNISFNPLILWLCGIEVGGNSFFYTENKEMVEHLFFVHGMRVRIDENPF